MKRFLPLLILTGLLFGQDVLTLKNGESYKGTYIGKVGEDIVFKVPLTSSVSSIFLKRITNTKKFPIWSVETIVTKNGELTYPFDIPIKELSKQDVLLHKSGKNYKGTFLGKVDEKIIFKIEGEKSNSAFSINDVDIIITSKGGIKVELYYPFDILIKQEYPFDTPTKQDYPRTGIRRSNSYGFFSEKMPFSFFDFSLSENIGGHSEFYGTFSYLFFGGGFGIGYKHYFINKSKYLGYVSANISKNYFGGGSVTVDFTTFSIGTGGRLFRNEKTTSFGFTVKSYLNIGISIYYVLSANKHMNMHENEIGVVPFINLEKRW